MSQQPTQPNGKRLVEALNLLKDVDSVELKLTVPVNDQHSAITALDMDVLDAEFRQVVFFDTPDLRLSSGGVVVRARRKPKGRCCSEAPTRILEIRRSAHLTKPLRSWRKRGPF